jgi:hypothetical protein
VTIVAGLPQSLGIIRQLLADLAVPELAPAASGRRWLLTTGPMIDREQAEINITPAGGFPPATTLAGPIVDYPTFIVRVRGDRGDYSGAELAARRVDAALDQRLTSTSGQQIMIDPLGPNPPSQYAGTDDDDRHIFSRTVTLWIPRR